jgi:TolA-binding protein
MNNMDVHPEHLLDEALAHDENPAALEEHLKACAACQLELEFGRALRAERRLDRNGSGNESETIERLVAGTVNELVSDGALQRAKLVALEPFRRRSGGRAWLVAAALTASAAGAAAAFFAGRASLGATAQSPQRGHEFLDARRQSPSASPLSESRTRAARDDEHHEATSAASDAGRPAQDGRAEHGEPKITSSERVTARATAAELFQKASRANGEGRRAEALGLYRDLHQTYPKSEEAHVARVAMGRLLLAREPARALEQFDGYLRRGGTLAPEALVGRARALQQLGRTADEQATWREVLARHPDSVYASEANKRLGIR